MGSMSKRYLKNNPLTSIKLLVYTMFMKVTTQQVFQIAAEAMTDKRTVMKIYEGKPVRGDLLRARVEAAAKKLKLPGPPAH